MNKNNAKPFRETHPVAVDNVTRKWPLQMEKNQKEGKYVESAKDYMQYKCCNTLTLRALTYAIAAASINAAMIPKEWHETLI